jgi:hypothetical protein
MLLAGTGLPEKRRESVAKYVNLGLSQRTWSSYRTAERMWRRCELETGHKLELPWGQDESLFFLDWLLEDRKVSGATASSYLAGMRKIHEIRGLAEPVLKSGLVNQVLKGKKNLESIEKRNRENKGRLPVTLTILKILKEAIRAWARPMGVKLLVWAVCTMAFHGSFRIHEILCRNETFFDPDFTLLEKDVTVGTFMTKDKQVTKVLHVTVKCPKESKTGRQTVVDLYETGGPTCPIKGFCQWKDRRSKVADPNSVLFSDGGGVPLTGKRFNAVLKELLETHIDYSKGQITAHSFRSGVPSLLGTLGFSDDDIKKVGRWSSRAFEHYTKLPRTSRAEIAQRLGKL